jgi:NADH-quinone oxidoreductase subunit E
MRKKGESLGFGASEKTQRKTGTDRKGGSGRGGSPLDPGVARWFALAQKEFPRSRSSTVPMLQSAQTALGYLPADAMRAIARHLRVAPAVVEGVASFYAQFRFEAPGRHRVTVCSGTACYVRGSGKLMGDLQADLHVASGATTADGEVTLESVSCFGACALAPVVVLDEKVLRQQTTESVRQAIRNLPATPEKPRSRAGRRLNAREARK